jgi:cytochrome c556
MSDTDADWPSNYFNYFTEIEEHFQRARGTGLFLLSPLDWALIESWKIAGVPLEAVLKGVDEAFEKWRSRKVKRRNVNSLAYCSQAVMEAAKRAPGTSAKHGKGEAPFSVEDLHAHLTRAAAALRTNTNPALHEPAVTLDHLAAAAAEHITHLEDLERRLTALEDKIVAILRAAQTEEDLYAIREALDRELSPYRGKMTAEQLSMLERRYLDTATLERAQIPRLSLFYLH